jgi:hypothetical protein
LIARQDVGRILLPWCIDLLDMVTKQTYKQVPLLRLYV